ncbi:hypothetical protein JHK84_050115 [Glycine max]|nr:hypothetical protein JHK84_050115 [Glycine max]
MGIVGGNMEAGKGAKRGREEDEEILHGKGNFSLNGLGCDTQNITLVDLVLGYLFRCEYEMRQMLQAGFSDVAKLKQAKIDDSLVTTLVERWRPESHMFHLLVGECIITLEDVALQLVYGKDASSISLSLSYLLSLSAGKTSSVWRSSSDPTSKGSTQRECSRSHCRRRRTHHRHCHPQPSDLLSCNTLMAARTSPIETACSQCN